MQKMHSFQQKINKIMMPVNSLLTLIILFFSCIIIAKEVLAEHIAPSNKSNYVDDIVFVEQEDAACSMSGGQLILIQNLSTTQAYQVWIDRWYMNVQTPDHTNQRLQPNAEPTPLGCSIARAGGTQYWTIYSIDAI